MLEQLNDPDPASRVRFPFANQGPGVSGRAWCAIAASARRRLSEVLKARVHAVLATQGLVRTVRGRLTVAKGWPVSELGPGGVRRVTRGTALPCFKARDR